jgi:acyl-coenzyme A synthetase/AMP-(fatty) acid ligase
MVEHASVVNHARACIELFQLTRTDRVLQFWGLSFDGSIEEIFPTLLAGATLVLLKEPSRMSIEELAQAIDAGAISVLDCPTSLWNSIIPALGRVAPILSKRLRLVCTGGEAMSADRYHEWRKWLPPEKVTLLNTYGPTEATVIATTFDPAGQSLMGPTVPIGRPLPNVSLYILDAHRQPVPIGVVGEIYIGGAAVARGYCNRPDLTAERFVPDPFSPASGARMYRTGDLGRYREDGNIEFRERSDHQVKIRGFRIEPGEIEAQLRRFAGVQEAIVVAREDIGPDKQLVAYVVCANDELTMDELRGHLLRHLPEYMTPAAIVRLAGLPLTPGGKVDRKALPRPDDEAYRRAEYEVPQGPIEVSLAQIWREVLHIERVGRFDNFFELGGHSLLAMQLIARVRADLETELKITEAFELPTLAAQAQRIVDIQLSQFRVEDLAAIDLRLVN